MWFVHDKLGLTAYAFALDDDIGNVNAGGATNVAIAVGGLGGQDYGLPQKDPYTNAVALRRRDDDLLDRAGRFQRAGRIGERADRL